MQFKVVPINVDATGLEKFEAKQIVICELLTIMIDNLLNKIVEYFSDGLGSLSFSFEGMKNIYAQIISYLLLRIIFTSENTDLLRYIKHILFKGEHLLPYINHNGSPANSFGPVKVTEDEYTNLVKSLNEYKDYATINVSEKLEIPIPSSMVEQVEGGGKKKKSRKREKSKRKAIKRKAIKRKATKRKTTKRKATKRKATKRNKTKRRKNK